MGRNVPTVRPNALAHQHRPFADRPESRPPILPRLRDVAAPRTLQQATVSRPFDREVPCIVFAGGF
jgi:hypothetical protein